MPTTFESLFIVVFFVIPGFISLWTVNLITPMGKKSELDKIINSLIFSFINYLIVFPSYIKSANFSENTESIILTKSYFHFITTILFVSILLGLLWGIIYKNDFVSKILWKIGITTLSGGTTTWDYAFSNFGEQLWVQVYLSDGTICEGITEHMSAYPYKNQLYLYKARFLDKNGNLLSQTKNNERILINAENIQIIKIILPSSIKPKDK